MIVKATEALERLRKGNGRFVAGTCRRITADDNQRRLELVSGQDPMAIILGCSDSRVPAELIFDQGLGDLFVIRVAGNVVASSQVGSVEFAAEAFGTRLVVVVGHSGCGAVQATLAELEQPDTREYPNLSSITDRIRPAVEPLMTTDLAGDAALLLQAAVRANIQASARQLRHGSPILERLIREDGLLVVGAEYSLETGAVRFFDGVPDGDEV